MLLFSCRNIKPIYLDDRQNGLMLTAALGGVEPDTNVTVYIVVTIYNPTTDTIVFTSMKCSFWDFFVTDTSAFEVQSGKVPCFLNGFDFIKLPPGKRTERYISLRPEKWSLIKGVKKLKIGMYLLKPKANQTYSDLINLFNNKKQAELIWSNELDL